MSPSRQQDEDRGALLRIFGRSAEIAKWKEICNGGTLVIEAADEGTSDQHQVAAWLSRFRPDNGKGRRAFFAWGNDALNTVRDAGVKSLEKCGFQLVNVISERATVSDTTCLGSNTVVAPGAIVGPRAQLGDNCVIENGAIVAASCRIGQRVWIGAGVLVADGATIGAGTTLGCGVRVASGVSIGEMCEVLVPGHYSKDLNDRTFYHPMFEEEVRFYRRRA
jgi:UDP-3-O-[3-hydroxymyristoyl] glucosamine N-acyltransferase